MLYIGLLGKVGGRAPEDVILELRPWTTMLSLSPVHYSNSSSSSSKCLPAYYTLWLAKIRYQFVRFCCKSLFHEIVSDK